MVTVVLDASALLRFLDDEAGAERIPELFQAHAASEARILLSAIHYGEVIGLSYKRGGQSRVDRIDARLKSPKIEIVAADGTRAALSGIIHVIRRIPYADSFGVQLAGDSPQHRLITADFDFVPAEQDITIEFLPAKPKP
jgi:PIN domain nuclease of toxin-antitoxin system